MNWKPNKWGAAVLSFFAPPLGMLYANRAWLAGVYFLVSLCVALAQFWLIGAGYNNPFLLVLSLALPVIAAIHGYRIAALAPEIKPRPWFSRWYGLLTIAMVAVIAITLFRAFMFEPFRLPAQSMFPTLPKGSYVVVRKYGYGNYASFGVRIFRTEVSAPLSRGDVLVFEYPRDRSIAYIKRIVGLPGDYIEYKDKRLHVNGAPLPTDPLGAYGEYEIVREAGYQIANEPGTPSRDFSVQVKPGHLFFLGDNRDNSNDSRFWGQVPYDYIIGKVVLMLTDKSVPALVPGKPPVSG